MHSDLRKKIYIYSVIQIDTTEKTYSGLIGRLFGSMFTVITVFKRGNYAIKIDRRRATFFTNVLRRIKMII